ncbi:MAG: aminopeptidase P family protein [Chloroflexi bacterium]|nr:aminopeptidase P family protein [Chloroflexota bacterium]
MNQRVVQLREVLLAQGLEAMVVTQPQNRRYLSGFTAGAPSDGLLVITPADAFVVTDFRYYEQAALEAPDYKLVKVTETLKAALAGHIKALALTRVGFESEDVSVARYGEWCEALPEVEWVPMCRAVETLRMRKDAQEIAAIERAVRLADEAMEHIMGCIHPGLTEREVAWELEAYMRTRGAEALSFPTIVAAGPHGSMPHAVTSDQRIERGDPVVIDMGCVIDGYCSDLTRSFCLGEPTDGYLRAWDTVLRAQLAAEEAIRAGISGVEADAVARRVIDEAGYEGRFGHSLGHGVGLAIHENPRASRTSEDTLAEGHVLTVEPGIYLPGQFGVRTEDMVLVTSEGCRVLTKVGKQPGLA